MNKLFLVRGLPGSGKSTFALTLADAIGAYTFEADHYHYTDDGVYDWKPENVHKAHSYCQWCTEMSMRGGKTVVVSNTFTTEKELKPYLDLAKQYHYHVTTLIVEGRHGNPSVHGVPQETLDKMRNRFSVKL